MNEPKTNADKYLKDGVTAEEFINHFKSWYFNQVNWMGASLEPATIAIEKFLKTEDKPTLTEDEKVILRNIKGFELIYRNSSGTLHFVTRRNTEVNHYCESGIFRDEAIEDGECVSCINHLFQFIKPRRRI